MIGRAQAGILALAAAQTVVWAALFYSFPALIPAIAADTGWDPATVAALFSATLLAAAAATPLAGRGIDRGLGALMLPGAAVVGGLLLLSSGMSGSFTVFAVHWVLIGFCYAGALYDPAFTLLTRTYGAAARKPITTVTLVAGFAGTLSFPLNALLVEVGGWRAAVLGMSGLVLLVGVPLTLLAMWLINPAANGPPPEPKTKAPLVKGRRFWALLAALTLLYFHVGAIIAHILPLLADRGLSPERAVFAAALIGPMQVAGRLALMTLGARRGELGLAVIAWSAVILSIPVMMAVAGAPGLVFAFVALHGAGYGVMSILRPLLIRSILGEAQYGRKAGLVNGCVALGGAIAPAAGAAAVIVGGYGAMLSLLAVALCLGLAALLVAARSADPA